MLKKCCKINLQDGLFHLPCFSYHQLKNGSIRITETLPHLLTNFPIPHISLPLWIWLERLHVNPPFHSDSLLSQWHTHVYLDKTGRCWSEVVAPHCSVLLLTCRQPNHQLLYLLQTGGGGTPPPGSHDWFVGDKREDVGRKMCSQF